MNDAGSARRAFYRFAAREIRRLVGGKLIEIHERKTGIGRPLHWGDFAVLVRSATEVMLLESIFRREGVPYLYYKKPRLYESLEAYEVSLLLASVLDPSNNQRFAGALLTTFFRMSFEEAAQSQNFDSDHWSRQYLALLAESAQRRDWPAFFRALLFRSRLLDGDPGPEWERHSSAMRQILEELEDYAIRHRATLPGLSAHLQLLMRSSRISVDDTGLYRRETEEDRVQIMTMHASKGLEFPVVFSGGGLTQTEAHMNSHLRYFAEGSDGRRVPYVHMICSGPEAPKAQYEAETEAENKRLYYVAFTRAVLKLYVPAFQAEKPRAAGPLQLFARRALEKAHPAGSDLVHRLELDRRGEIVRADEPPPKLEQGKTRAAGSPAHADHDISRILSEIPRLEKRARELYSYSGLVKHTTAHFEAEEKSVKERVAPSEGESGEVSEPPVDVISGMRGRQFGIFLHSVLETVLFEEFREREELFQKKFSLINNLLDEHGYDPELCRDGVHELLQRILTSPIPVLDHTALCDIPADDRTAEMEFYMKAPESIQLGPESEMRLDEHGIVWGFIDLVLRFRNRVYLIDWKTDVLPDYDPVSLENAVREKGYAVQAALYSEAVRRWAAAAAPDAVFGGALYFFVRGMDPARPGRGIAHLEAPA